MHQYDYYNILGVEKNATAEQIKKAYREKAFSTHPDRNPGDKEAEARFKQIQAAYETLIDVNARARYNGHTTTHSTPRRPQPKKKQQQSPFKAAPKRNADLRIYDAPPPSVDLWGRPLSPAEKAAWVRNNVSNNINSKESQEILDGWKDSYFNQYEGGGTPDLRG